MPEKWRPQPGPQLHFFLSPADEILYGGALGGGKTDAVIAGPLQRITDPQFRGIIFRESMRQLREWIIPRTRELYTEYGAVFNQTGLVWTFPSGAIVRLGYMENDNDAEKYKGIPYQYMGFDELTYFSFYQYSLLQNWCRPIAGYWDDQKQERNEELGLKRRGKKGQVCEVKCSGMPMGPYVNWVKEYFVDNGDRVKITDPKTGKTRQYIKSLLEDNKKLHERAPDYGDALKALGPELYEALRHADWSQIIGAAFKELAERHHKEPYKPPPVGVQKFRMGDWGFSSPFAIYWAYLDNNRVMHIFHEYYGTNTNDNKGIQLSSREVAKEIKKIDDSYLFSPDDRIIGYLDPSCWAKHDDEPDIAANMASEGVYWIAANNNRIQGKQEFHTRLSLANNGPYLKIADSCKHFWRTVPSLPVDKNRSEDVDTKMEDHAYDAVRYGVMSVPMLPGTVKRDGPASFGKRDSYEKDDENIEERYTNDMDWG